MSVSKRLGYYTKDWWELCQKIGEENKIYTLTFPTKSTAWAWRGKLYGFQGALRRGAEEADFAKKLQTEANKESIEAAKLLPFADKVMVLVTGPNADGTWTVKASRREDSWESQAIRAAVVTQGELKVTPTVAKEAEDANKRFEEALKNGSATSARTHALVSPEARARTAKYGSKQ